MPNTYLGSGLQKQYKDRGLMPGFFSWLEELGRPVNDVDLLGIDVEVREVPSKDDYRAFERTGKSTVSVHFKDGTDQRKTFTDEELQHGGHK